MLKKYFYGKHYIDRDDILEINKSLKNQLSQGPFLKQFEKKVLKYFNVKYCVAVSSATAALHIAIKALNMKSNSKVYTSAMTFVATVNTCLYNNLDVNLIDIDKKDLNIDLKSLETKLSKLSKIKQKEKKLIIPVHFGGLPVDNKKLSKIAKKYNCFIIEDGSQAMGSNFNGIKIGSCKGTDLCVFSLHPVKSITTGEGGLILTNNKIWYKKLLLLRSHGLEKYSNNYWESDMKILGFNYKITEFQSALGVSQLNKLNKFIYKRNKIAEYYLKKLKNLDIKFQEYDKKTTRHAFHYFIISFKKKLSKKNILDMTKSLSESGIFLGRQYKPINFHTYYKKKFKEKFKNSINYYNQSFQLPIYPGLKKRDLDFIIDKFKKMYFKYNL